MDESSVGKESVEGAINGRRELLIAEARQAKAPNERLGSFGARVPSSGGSRSRGEGMLIVFMTLDQLKRYGPLGLRLWLEKNRPTRPPRVRPAEVLEFTRGDHQEALAVPGSSSEVP